MKLLKSFLILNLLGFGLSGINSVDAQSIIQTSVLGNGGVVVSDGNYNIGLTLGQPIIGQVTSPIFQNKIGFWYLSTRFITGINQKIITLPKTYWLGQNYPNPFNLVTLIPYNLPEKAFVELKIYDTLGREVRTLINEYKDAGQHQVKLELQNFSSGPYFFQLKTKAFINTKRLMLVK
ncbi:MAG TPA: T9SS type A sorting domain-containing protein [bacterium]|nr:T9SS type A sorting domain-containing protein [bacterium]HPN42042.1 T9SS type A sorting domain-containing protein [bacterium]